MTPDERPEAVSVEDAMRARAEAVAKVRASENAKALAHLTDTEILDRLWADIGQPGDDER